MWRRSTAPCGTSWLICSHNSALAGTALLRMETNGERRAVTSESPTSRAPMRCPFPFNDARVTCFINAPAAGRSFRECAESNERSPVWNAAANSTVENLIAARSFDLCKEPGRPPRSQQHRVVALVEVYELRPPPNELAS